MNLITNDTDKCEQALQALKQVMDPEIGLNIVDLGLIYQFDVDDAARKIFCTMTLTTQYCPMGASITDAARQALEDSFKVYEVELILTFDPPWTQERISADGREFLNRE